MLARRAATSVVHIVYVVQAERTKFVCASFAEKLNNVTLMHNLLKQLTVQRYIDDDRSLMHGQ